MCGGIRYAQALTSNMLAFMNLILSEESPKLAGGKYQGVKSGWPILDLNASLHMGHNLKPSPAYVVFLSKPERGYFGDGPNSFLFNQSVAVWASPRTFSMYSSGCPDHQDSIFWYGNSHIFFY